MKFYTPIICEETGYYGGNFHCLAPSLKQAFRMLKRRIAEGKVQRISYEPR